MRCLPSLTRSLAATPLKQINNFIMKWGQILLFQAKFYIKAAGLAGFRKHEHASTASQCCQLSSSLTGLAVLGTLPSVSKTCKQLSDSLCLRSLRWYWKPWKKELILSCSSKSNGYTRSTANGVVAFLSGDNKLAYCQGDTNITEIVELKIRFSLSHKSYFSFFNCQRHWNFFTRTLQLHFRVLL